MPQLQEFASPEQREAAWKAHVIRTTNDIAQYRAKLDQLRAANDPATMDERLLIEDQIKTWEAQLRPPAATPTASSVETLKAQVAALSSQVTTLIQSAAKAMTSEPKPTEPPPTDG